MRGKTIFRFPKKFLWGAATSAYQVEGGITNNDWAADRKLPRAGKACDHYNRFAEDFQMAKNLGHNSHRLSLEWSRLQPQVDSWDISAFEHYREVLSVLKKKKLKIFLTLHHFTNPTWFMREGGWERSVNLKYFENYVRRVASELGDLVDFWITINEPNIYAAMGYLAGIFPPHKKGPIQTLRVYKNMLRAHNSAYRIIHRTCRGAKVGFAQNFSWRQPFRKNSFWDREVVRFLNWTEFVYTYKHTKNDFIGVNHYFDSHLRFVPDASKGFIQLRKHPGVETDRGWAIHAHGLYQVLTRLKHLKKPIYITENGLADATDTKRAFYIAEYLAATHQAIAEGASVRGYLHWSLLDNFEWEAGYKWKFGLVRVNFRTQRRTVRKSAKFYAKICKTNSLTL